MNGKSSTEETARPSVCAEVRNIRVVVMLDSDPDASWLEQEGNEDRLAAFNEGQFGFCAVRVEADLYVPHGSGFIVQPVMSPGLWGIEDDSGDDYLREVAADQYVELRHMLDVLHVTPDDFDAATADIEYR